MFNNKEKLPAVFLFAVFIIANILFSCSSTRLIPTEKYLVEKVSIEIDNKNINKTDLSENILQHPNSKWFSAFKVPLSIYSMAGKDSNKWINRFLKKMGEDPVIFDSLKTLKSKKNLLAFMNNKGFFNSKIVIEKKYKKKKVELIYRVNSGKQWHVNSFQTDIRDSNIATIIKKENLLKIKNNDVFSIENLDQQRKEITKALNEKGYFLFNKENIFFTADSSRNKHFVNLTMHIKNFKEDKDLYETPHPQYTIRNVTFHNIEEGPLKLRKNILLNNTLIKSGELYNSEKLEQTYNNFAKLAAVKYVNIKYAKVPNYKLLDCDIYINTRKPSTLAFQPEGTNTAGDLGAAASLTYENRNLFQGSELLTIQLRGAFEAIKGLEGYQKHNYQEYSIESKLRFPRLILPFINKKKNFSKNASTEFSLTWNLQNRPEFHRRVFSAAWKYSWQNSMSQSNYRWDILDLNYVYMPWISETFKKEYLDDISKQNAILRYNYEDIFIIKSGIGMTYMTRNDVLRSNIETAGNILNLLSKPVGMKKNSQNQSMFFNIAYAQYAKVDLDYTHFFHFDSRNVLALHTALGVAYPYGNSKILPFEKRYFAGGANSVRGWSVRELGPGKYKNSNGKIDFINQTGDIKLDLNAELRSSLFWKLDGALFLDAGNIWTIRDYKDQPGGRFSFQNLLNELAIAYGVGIRLNFGYFIIRIDMGIKAVNPAYTNSKEHFPIAHFDFKRDACFHFAVGLPF